MPIKIGINGFGRIGRSVFRAAVQNPAFKDIEIVAVNDLTDSATLAHLLKYDSVMGQVPGDISVTDKGIMVNGKQIMIISRKNPAELPWSDMGVEYVAECTGLFRDRSSAENHLKAGAKKVVISAPASGDIKTFVMVSPTCSIRICLTGQPCPWMKT